jgi:uncharacterized protein YgiM (DUF1202 family)
VKRRAAPALLLSALAAAAGHAATAYVTDELVLGVYAEENQQGVRLTTLHSGASVETLSTHADFTQVRLGDGATGWVKTAYLTTREPATVRVKRLEEELDRRRAAPAALAEAAARSEVERLQRELAARQSELEAARAGHSPPAAAAGVLPARNASARPWGVVAGAACIAALLGFWLGYATLARRVKRRFGGIRVY